jgi:hypothetical protein
MGGDYRQGVETRDAGLRSAVGDGGTRPSCTPTASADGEAASRGVHRGSARGRHPGAAGGAQRGTGEAQEGHGEARRSTGGEKDEEKRDGAGAASVPRAGPRACECLPGGYLWNEISSTSKTSIPFGLPSSPR